MVSTKLIKVKSRNERLTIGKLTFPFSLIIYKIMLRNTDCTISALTQKATLKPEIYLLQSPHRKFNLINLLTDL